MSSAPPEWLQVLQAVSYTAGLLSLSVARRPGGLGGRPPRRARRSCHDEALAGRPVTRIGELSGAHLVSSRESQAVARRHRPASSGRAGDQLGLTEVGIREALALQCRNWPGRPAEADAKIPWPRVGPSGSECRLATGSNPIVMKYPEAWPPCEPASGASRVLSVHVKGGAYGLSQFRKAPLYAALSGNQEVVMDGYIFSPEYRKSRGGTKCPKCGKFLLNGARVRKPDGTRALFARNKQLIITCPKCGQSWNMYVPIGQLPAAMAVKEIVATVRMEEPIG